jgi:NTE family protein
MAPIAPPPRPASYDKKVALVLQGGGALGSYQAGVYEALATSAYPPDWVAGISIGAINAALIAGNAPEKRVDRLRAFWDEVTSAPLWPGVPAHLVPDAPSLSAAHAVLFGQPGFFAPRPLTSWFTRTQPLSFYETRALKGTLERLVDFDRINAREIRFSVGSVNVRTGNFAYFDNAEIEIRPEHVMASGALPPGFPPVEIDGEFYWDGGLVSNTPLQYIIDTMPRRSRLTFQIDLFSARGPLPTDLDTVGEREKDIRYSSRTRAGTDACRTVHDVRHIINELLERQPELRDSREGRILYEFACVTTMDIAQLIYRPGEDQGVAKDFEFGHATMLARWAAGLSDAQATLRASPWLAPMPPEVGVRTFDVLGDQAKQQRPPRGR